MLRMKTVAMPILVGLFVLGVTRVSPAQIRGGRTELPTRRLLATYGLERAWWNQATMNPARDRVLHLVADEDVFVVQSRSGVITVFDAENGKKLWARRLGRRDAPAFPATTNDDMTLVVIGTHLYALDKFTGAARWDFRLPVAPSTSAEIDSNNVYVGARDGSVFAFDLEKVLKFYKEGLLPQWSFQTMAWRYKGFKDVSTPPISTGRVLNFATRGGQLYSITIADRKLVFQFETDEPISAPMAVSKRALYLPSEDFKLYCIDADSGETLWTYNSGLAIRKAPQIIGNDVFITPSGGGIHAIDSFTGNRRWWRPKVKQFVAASRKTVFASDTVGNLLMLRREDGAVTAALPLRSFSVRLANDRTDRIFIARPDGLIVCIREQGAEFPVYHKYPERRPILPEFAPGPNSPTSKSKTTPKPNKKPPVPNP